MATNASGKLVKEREDNASQLNRLGVAYFLLCLLPISTTLLRHFRRRPVSAASSFPAQVRAGEKNSAFISAQVLAEG